jgi:hypothetical protein
MAKGLSTGIPERKPSMTNDSISKTSSELSDPKESRAGLVKIGAVAVASALLGGIAAAWWYRKTVRKLHESGENHNNPHFGIETERSAPGSSEEI